MKVDGVNEAKADYQKNWAWAKYDPSKVSPEQLVDVINKKTSFKAKLPPKKEDKQEKKDGSEP